MSTFEPMSAIKPNEGFMLILLLVIISILIAILGVGYFLGGSKGVAIAALIPIGFYGFIKFKDYQRNRSSVDQAKNIEMIDAMIRARPNELEASGLMQQARQNGLHNYKIIKVQGGVEEIKITQNKYSERIAALNQQMNNMRGAVYIEGPNSELFKRFVGLNDEAILLQAEYKAFVYAVDGKNMSV